MTLSLVMSLSSFSQVGVVTLQPYASLHVTPVSLGATTAEGIIAPNLTRLQLVSKDNVYTASQQDALVYVTTLDGGTSPKTQNVTKVGYYYFDGLVWQAMDKSGEYFYLPSFDLPINSVGTGRTFDIYNNVYLKQFDKAVNTQYTSSNSLLTKVPVSRYAATELDYVVTYYDNEVMKINSISPSGVINYDVLSADLGPSSFVNIVLITK